VSPPNNPANNCNTTNPTPNVSIWCWAYTDPDVDAEVPGGYAYAIPPDFDYVALNGYATNNTLYSPPHNDFKDTFNALRSLTTKPFVSFTPTWWLCPLSGGVPTCTTTTFPITGDACTSTYTTAESIASCPAEDLFRYTDMVNGDDDERRGGRRHQRAVRHQRPALRPAGRVPAGAAQHDVGGGPDVRPGVGPR
jgi:hypothetical protein